MVKYMFYSQCWRQRGAGKNGAQQVGIELSIVRGRLRQEQQGGRTRLGQVYKR